jgi:hypothetical protein
MRTTAMSYKITTDYLEHRGGTKFYEVVMIEEEDGPCMTIKRYGPIVNKISGGQIIIERGSSSSVRLARDKILKEKTASAKGYSPVTRPMSGMHDENGNRIQAPRLQAIVEDHYATKNAADIKNYFGLAGSLAAASDDDIITEEPEEAKPEIEAPRDSTWGSW